MDGNNILTSFGVARYIAPYKLDERLEAMVTTKTTRSNQVVFCSPPVPITLGLGVKLSRLFEKSSGFIQSLVGAG